jgi:hypothetical protein
MGCYKVPTSSYGLERGLCRYVSIKSIESTEPTLIQNKRPPKKVAFCAEKIF